MGNRQGAKNAKEKTVEKPGEPPRREERQAKSKRGRRITEESMDGTR